MNSTIMGFIKKEFAQTLRDPRMRLLLFVAPIIQLLLLGYAISNEVKNVKLAVLYSVGDTLSEKIEEHCAHIESFRLIDGRGQDPMFLIESGQADAVLIAPARGLTRTLARGEGRLQLLIDATNVLRARSVEQYVRAIVAKTVAGQFSGLASPVPFSFDVRVLYNPAMNTSYFLVPGVMALLLCLLTVIMTSMSLVRERELGTFETLVSAPVSNSEILLGKTLPYVLLGIMQMLLILMAALFIFRLPMTGAWWKFALAAVVYICTTIAVGIFISTIARNQQQAMMGSFMFLFSGILLSGLMFPVENMPEVIRGIAYLNPIKYFLTLLRNIMLKGGDNMVFWTNLGALVLLAVGMMGLSLNRFRQTLN